MKWKEKGCLSMNKTTKHYFTSLFKRKRKLLILYTFICFIAYPFLEIASLITNGNANTLIDITRTSFTLALFVLAILAAVLPIFTFKFSHTKKHVDTYFSIPMNRNHLFKSHFLGPIFGVCVPLLINYLLGGAILIFFRGSIVHYFEMLGLLLLAFALFAVIYSINSYFVLNTNNVLDSAIITAGVAILPFVLSSAVTWFVDTQITNTGMIQAYSITDVLLKLLSPYVGFINLGSAFSNFFGMVYLDFDNILWGYIFYYLVLGVVFYLLARKTFKKKKGENAEQLTKAFVTYPLMINIGIISLVMMFNLVQMELVEAVLSFVALFIVYMVAKAIANRSVAFNAKMILQFVILVGLVNGFNYISKQTEFFGINRKVIDYNKYDIVDIYYYPFDEIYDENGEDREFRHRIYINDLDENEKEFFELIEEVQKERSIYLKKTGKSWASNTRGNLEINYKIKDGAALEVDRFVNFNLNLVEQKKFLALYDQLKDE